MSEGLAVVRHCKDEAACADLPDMWRSVFLHEGVLCSHKGSPSQWFFSLGCFSIVALLWPASEVKVGKSRFWRPHAIKSPEEMVFRPVLSFKDWSAIPTESVSPLRVCVENKKIPATMPGFWCMQTGAAIPFIKHAAKCAYWNTRAPIMKRLMMDEYGVEGSVSPDWP